MINKYRVHEVAKDFNIKSNVVLELLAKYFADQKKHMTALEETELDVIFETFTQQHQVESFDKYFALQNEKKPEPAAEKAEKKEAPAGEKPAQDTPAKPAAQQQKPQSAGKQPSQQQKPPQQLPKKKQKDANRQPQARTKGESRTVDTRGAGNVNLDKYNEKYETIAPVNRSMQNDHSVGKQKIKQKSQQYRRGGMRQSRKETEQERLKRIAAERAKKPQLVIKVPEQLTVGELAAMLKRTAAEVIKKMFTELGLMATVNEVIDFDTAELIATELGAKVEKEVVVTIEERIIDDSADDESALQPRDPVVVVMGHVDHGKTSLLDAVRKTNVVSGEAGGITQHIGAYTVSINGNPITFLDTPGHAAFTSMRARGAMCTDIAILVVAADDGVMPQTIEAINHAKAANIPIIVAVNKMDKPGANPDRILTQLTEHDLVPSEWGGDTEVCRISAKSGEGIDELLETVIMTAELANLKANPNRAAKGTVIEARLDKNRGPIATLLVQNGTLHKGDLIIAGTAVGRVRVMTDDKGRTIAEAGPSIPVEITGLAETPAPGDEFNAVADERMARQLVEQRKQAEKDAAAKVAGKVTLDNLFAKMQEGEMKELNLIVKADVQGSAEAVKASLEKISNEEVRVRVIHAAVGAINESDILLASTANAIVVGFNVRPDPAAAASAKRDNVDLRMYRVIYDAIDEIEAAMKGLLAPKYREAIIGHAEVRQTYKVSAIGTIAGCYVKDGKITRDAQVRVLRDNIVIYEGNIGSLQRFKDSVKEVAANYECGISIEKFNDIKEGDIFECFVMEEVPR